MPHFFERTALILLAGTALTAAVPAVAAAQAPASGLPERAVAATGVDVFARAPAATYKVRKGDTLAEIAGRLDTTVEDLAKANGLKRPYRLQPGQVLKNPKAPKPQAARNARTSSGGAGAAPGVYTVRSGDTLFGIAQKNGVSVDALREVNGLRGTSISAGQRLKLPGSVQEAARAAAPDEDAALADRMASAAAPRNEPQAPSASAPPPSSGERTTTEQRVTGRVVSIDVPGKSYKVKSGDNLERIAGRLDSSVDELARLNKLKKPYRLQPGQTIRGPGTSARAYTVGRGDTVADIARRFGVTEAELRSANGLRRGAAVAPGRRLRLPAGYRDRGPITATVRAPEAAAPPPSRPAPSSFDTPAPVGQRLPPPRSAPRPPEVVLPDQPQPYRPPPGQTPYPRSGSVPGAPVASPQVSDGQISEMGRGMFIWPIQGQVISGFGGRGQGPRNDGLNIRGNAGDPVRAAAAGDIVYAGDQVPGFGNLVLVKHADGWVTAYGHLGKVDVRMQQRVTQGQTIGQVGTSGGVSEPQLHFEVRYAPTAQERARPIDPALVLPR